MKESVPVESDELFESALGSGHDYIPGSQDDSDESSSDNYLSFQSVKQGSLADADNVPDSTTSNTMDIGEECTSVIQRKTAVVVKAVKKTGDGGRVYSKRHYCLFCLKPFSKMARHLEYVHSSKREVAEACKYPKGSKQRRMHLDDMHLRGDFVHNAAVIKSGQGDLVPYKQPQKNSKGSEFMHCAYCQGLFSRNILWWHLKVCKLGPKNCVSKPGKNRIQSLCAFTQPVPSDITKIFHKTLSLMTTDDITTAVKEMTGAFYN